MKEYHKAFESFEKYLLLAQSKSRDPDATQVCYAYTKMGDCMLAMEKFEKSMVIYERAVSVAKVC